MRNRQSHQASRLASPMSSSPVSQGDAPGTTTTASSCFALAWHVWSLCALHVVLVFSSVAVAAAIVVLLPFACMVVSLCLVCAITALLLAPRFPPQEREAERGGGEVGGSVNDGASSREEEEHQGDESELEASCCQGCAAAHADGAPFSDGPLCDEQEQFFWLDTGSGSYYCYEKFYELLAFWRRKERACGR